MAYGLSKDDAYFQGMRARPRSARATCSMPRLDGAGFQVLPSAATYFLNVDLAAVGRFPTMSPSASALVQQTTALPRSRSSAFYAETPVTSVVRFCFAKKDETLNGALDRLVRVFAKAA